MSLLPNVLHVVRETSTPELTFLATQSVQPVVQNLHFASRDKTFHDQLWPKNRGMFTHQSGMHIKVVSNLLDIFNLQSRAGLT